MWAFLAPLLTGFLGGFFASFVSTPFLQFRELRKRIRSQMHYFDNIAPVDGSDLQKARDTLRALSTDLLAFAETEPKVVMKLLRWIGYDPKWLLARS